MRNYCRVSTEDEQRRVTDALKAGAAAWAEIRRASGLRDDRLGLVLVDLIEERRVRTESRGEVRTYRLAPND